jgi:ATP-binding cassette subfamily C (CFTR/MRP) protein 1
MVYRGHALMRIPRIIFIQRWLSMRLDMCGNILLLAIGIYTAVRRYSVDPAKIGVILSYSITSAWLQNYGGSRLLTPSYSNSDFEYASLPASSSLADHLIDETVQLYGTTEANMNSVERMLHYTELPSEEGRTVKSSPTPSWPSDGTIRFDHVDYAYREGEGSGM